MLQQLRNQAFDSNQPAEELLDKQVAISSEPLKEFSRATLELERAFKVLRTRLWFKQEEMPLPVITIQSSGRRRSVGWFVRKAWTDGRLQLPEINLSAEHLRRPVVEIIGTLVHEMVHHSNYLARDRDCSGNNYHNRVFKGLAERVKLICERADDGKNLFGWAYTTPSAELCQIIQEINIDKDAFALYREIPIQRTTAGEAWNTNKQAEPKLKKWSCGCTNVWSAVELRAFCCKPECGGQFRRSVVFR